MKTGMHPLKPEPHPLPEEELPAKFKADKWTQAKLDKPPIHAIAIKGAQLRAAMRGGNPVDWVDIHERFVDLWQEARLCIWRAKRTKIGVATFDPVLNKTVQGYVADNKTVLAAIDTTRAVLDSIIKLRREMGHGERGGLPRWAIEKIEKGLRNHPEAQTALLKELMTEDDAK